MHYRRFKKHGDPLYEPAKVPDACTVDGCDRPYDSRGYCKMHAKRDRVHGDPLGGATNLDGSRRGARPDRVCVICKAVFSAPANYPHKQTCSPQCRSALAAWSLWRTEPTYRAVHFRIKAVKGAAKNYTCACGEPAKDWAYVGPRRDGERYPFSANMEHYAPLCRTCHADLDH